MPADAVGRSGDGAQCGVCGAEGERAAPASSTVTRQPHIASAWAGAVWGAWSGRPAQAFSKELKASRGELPAWEAPAAHARELLKEAEGLGVRMDAELKALQVCSEGRAGRAG